ncbi:FixH family protein [Shumkonia mesophila]|uniref:FixH family protein n=1 Tax=Shumkonia mesophila TaxID=2838854 RepID=UPI002934AFE1|nr:FixH family protein [Shumkonia mesophila]
MARARADGWWYPWIFVAAMGVVVLVNGALVAFALESWTGLETVGHYEKGLAYNRDLAAAQAQAERGWRFAFALDGIAGTGDTRTGTLSATFADRDGTPLTDLEVRAVIRRPIAEGYDREVTLASAGHGRYGAPAVFPLPGQWEVRIHAYRGDTVFQESRRVSLP